MKVDDIFLSINARELAFEIERLRQSGLEVPDPQEVEGFDSLRCTAFTDPDGNTVNLLEGA